MLATLWRYIHPDYLVEEINSPFQGMIQVRKQFGRPRVIVAGTPQSGGIVTDILKQALKHFHQPKNFLLLGLGGGDILWQIHRKWPGCQIIAVEIDSSMIEIARKYFHVDRIPNLKIINQDAYKFVKLEAEYAAILVDCYFGDQILSQLENVKFIKNLRKILSSSGTIVFNRLNTKNVTKSNQDLIIKLLTVFSSVNTQLAYCNMMVSASR